MPSMPIGRDSGFSLVEVVVSSALLLLVASAVIAVANPVVDAAHSHPEAIDLHQHAQRSRARSCHIARHG